MLKLFPVAGTILLTVIIAYGLYRGWRTSRGRIADALALRLRSTCCNARITPLGWTQDGWVSTCDECHAFQYLGDDHDNPPSGFRHDGRPTGRFHSGGLVGDGIRSDEVPARLSNEFIVPLPNAASKAPRPAASEPESRPSLSRDSGSPHNSMGAAIRRAIMPEVTSLCTCDPLDRPPVCPRKYAVSDCVAAYRAAYPEIAAMWSDEGEPLLSPPQPNIGGLGNPPYAGPHYDVPHDRFVPYDVLGEPIPGTAVHFVGNAACMGPLPEIDGDNNIREFNPDDEA